MINKSFERLRPGGWLEMQEADIQLMSDHHPISPDNAMQKWFQDMRRASLMANRPIHVAPLLKQMFINAGFVDVHEKVYKIPMNGWPRGQRLKKVGEMWHHSMRDGLSGFSYALFNRWLGMTTDEIEVSNSFVYIGIVRLIDAGDAG